MKYAMLCEVEEGDTVRVDGGFTCLDDGEIRVVERFKHSRNGGGLFIRCNDGKHFLDGQLDQDDKYVGIELIEKKNGQTTSPTV